MNDFFEIIKEAAHLRKKNVVKMSGLEPPTPCMSSRYSNQLSYTFIYRSFFQTTSSSISHIK